MGNLRSGEHMKFIAIVVLLMFAMPPPGPIAVGSRILQQKLFDLPELSGRYGVGRISYHLTDVSSAEALSTDSGKRREVMVNIWYPAEVRRGAERISYYPYWSTVKETMGKQPLMTLAGASFAALDSGQLRSHATENAPVSKAKSRYPVL